MRFSREPKEEFKCSSSSPPSMERQCTDMLPHPSDNHLLTVKEVAFKLRLSRSGVYSLIRRGVLPYVNLACGTRLLPRIDATDLEAFIESRRQSGKRSNQGPVEALG